MDQQITCPSCGTVAATLTTRSPHGATPRSVKPTDDLSENVERFVRQHCALGSDSLVSAAALCDAYSAWASRNNVDPISRKRFSMEVVKLPGVTRTRNQKERLFAGVRLVP